MENDLIGCPDNNPKCKGWYKDNGGEIDDDEYGCLYNTEINCEDCMYGSGSLNPEQNIVPSIGNS